MRQNLLLNIDRISETQIMPEYLDLACLLNVMKQKELNLFILSIITKPDQNHILHILHQSIWLLQLIQSIFSLELCIVSVHLQKQIFVWHLSIPNPNFNRIFKNQCWTFTMFALYNILEKFEIINLGVWIQSKIRAQR